MTSDILTQDQLKQKLHYNPKTGLFTWRIRPSRRAKIGDIAGYLSTSGYIRIGISGNSYKAHRLAFLYMTGTFPKSVDHIDHNRSNNEWENLRAANHKINSHNRSLNFNNTSGFNGVVWDGDCKKWRASIFVEGKRIHLGRYINQTDAIEARKAANFKYSFHPNHGY